MTEIRIQPDSPEALRLEIAKTRARMSATIDEIEDVIVEKKENFREAVDVPARIRTNPLRAIGVAAASGLLLGLLTGGGKDDEIDTEEADYRSLQWEQRARRLLAIAQEQEEEIERLEAERHAELVDYVEVENDEVDDPGRLWYRRVRARIEASAREAERRLRERVPEYLDAAERGIRRRLDR